jgi:tRNA (cmo5U34)-methyltransferase
LEKTNHFDDVAREWDNNENRQKLASAVADAIMRNLHIEENTSVVDYGAGTGLVSLKLAQAAKHVTALDSSAGMVDFLLEKIEKNGISNISAEVFDIQDRDYKSAEKFDVLTCSMTLHHMSKVNKAAKGFFKMLKQGGYIAVADLMPEDGSFHDSHDGVSHAGFSEKALKKVFTKAGFVYLTYEKVFETERNGEKYGVFLMVGEKAGPIFANLVMLAGHLLVATGLIALLIPLVPTVPFLLGAAACYLASNRRLYAWLIHHKYLGPMVRDYLDKKGLPIKAKIITIACIITPALISAIVFLRNPLHWLLMMILPVILTVYVLMLPVKK